MKVPSIGFASALCVLSLGFAPSALAEGEASYLTVTETANCSILVNGVAASFGEIPYSATTTVEVRPNSGYEFLGWDGAVPFGTATNNPLVVKAGKIRTIAPLLRTYYAPATRTSTNQTADWYNNTWTWPSQIKPGPNDDVVLDGSKLTCARFVVCKSLTIRNGGRLVIVTDGGNSTDVSATGNSAIKGLPNSKLESASLFVKGDLKLESGGQLAVGAQSWTVNQDYAYAPYGSDVQVGGNVTLTGSGSKMLVCGGPITNDFTAMTGSGFMTVGGTLSIATDTALYLVSHGYDGGSVFVRAKAIELAAGGTVNADTRGFSGKKVSGGQAVATLAPGLGYSSWKGGGYGGAGYIGSWNASKCPAGYGATYGYALAPVYPGSPSGCDGSQYWRYVAPGGGLVRLRAASMNLAGTITANGGREYLVTADKYGYASSGGGIWLTTSTRELTIAQTAKFLAKGGVANYDAAHGGGGRIAITKNADDATEKYMAEHGALPEKRKILGLDGFHAEYPDVTVDVSSAGGAACAGSFSYVDNTLKGLSVIVR